MKKIAFIGGDARMYHASEYLSRIGYKSVSLNNLISNKNKSFYLETIKESDVIVLPAPASLDGIHIRGTVSNIGELTENDINYVAKTDATLLSGTLHNIYNRNAINYMTDEKYLSDMAYITAEGALGHLLFNSNKSLNESEVVIIGWGRIAKGLYKLSKPIAMNITAVMRNTDAVSTLNKQGVKACELSDLKEVCTKADIIINTVPHTVVGEEVLKILKPGVYLSDLASSPGGFDFETAKKIGIHINRLSGLPGKTAPISAGEKLAKCIQKYIN